MNSSNNEVGDTANLKGFGYFTPDDLDVGVHAKDYVDNNWDEQ